MIQVFLLLMQLICVTSRAQTPSWTLTGPVQFPSNLTGQINGIGRVCQIKFDPVQPNTLYACSASGGLWKSLNAGSNWQLLGTDTLPAMNIASVCIDPTNPQILYMGSGDPNYYSTDLGIWKSTDGGQSWFQSSNGLGNLMAVEILMDSLDHLTLLAATNNGIWKTTDGGLNWINKLSSGNFTDMVWQPASGSSIVFASTMNKFFRSTDRGETWTEITAGLGAYLGSGTRIAVSPSNPALVYLATVKDEGTILRSLDSGQSFTLRYHNPTWSLTGYDSTGGGQGNYNFCIEADPLNPDQLYLASHNIMRSDDGGQNWQKLTKWWLTVHTDMHDFAFQPGMPHKLFNANDGGVWLTTDSGVNWIQTSDGLSATENYQAAVSPQYPGLISTGTQDNGELVYLDGAWKTNRGGDWTTKMQMDYSPQRFVYYFDDEERRSLPSGGGASYNTPAPVTPTNIKHLFSPDQQELGYISANSIWQTKNLTSSNPVWTQIVNGTTIVRALAACKGYPQNFAYIVSNKINISHNALDATPTFNQYTLPVTVSSGDLVWSGRDTQIFFLLAGQKVFRSTDGGQTFTDISGSLPAVNHYRIFLNEHSVNEDLYIGNHLGVWYRNKTMSDWVNFSNGLPTIAPLRNLQYFNDGGTDAKLYVSYFGRGVWETPLVNNSTCPVPSNLQISMSGGAIQLNWNSVAASGYEIQYRETGTTAWKQYMAVTNAYSFIQYAGCTTYEARVRSRCGTDSSLWSARVYLQTPSNPLGSDFDQHQDIGAVGVAGDVCYDSQNQLYTLLASGDDIWNQSDEFHFLHRKWVGDVRIQARVKHIGNLYGWAKGGLMIRETLNPDSKHSMCVLTPGNGFANQWRPLTADNSQNVDTPGIAPGWVSIERLGNQFVASFSTDGINWQVFSTQTINMNDTVYIGLANCSHIDTAINEVVIDQIQINGKALYQPGLQVEPPFTCYPNPGTDELFVHMHKQWEPENLQIELFDMQGKSCLRTSITAVAHTIRLDTKRMIPGRYILQIQGKHTWRSSWIKY